MVLSDTHEEVQSNIMYPYSSRNHRCVRVLHRPLHCTYRCIAQTAALHRPLHCTDRVLHIPLHCTDRCIAQTAALPSRCSNGKMLPINTYAPVATKLCILVACVAVFTFTSLPRNVFFLNFQKKYGNCYHGLHVMR